jgi:hypothetical protein
MPSLSRHNGVKVTVLARPLLKPLAQKLCWCKYGVFTGETYVYYQTLLHTKIFSAAEAFRAFLILRMEY